MDEVTFSDLELDAAALMEKINLKLNGTKTTNTQRQILLMLAQLAGQLTAWMQALSSDEFEGGQ